MAGVGGAALVPPLPVPSARQDRHGDLGPEFAEGVAAGTPDVEEVRLAKSPMIAARMGRSRKRPHRPDWEAVKDSTMHEAVRAKFAQHADLRATLTGTGDARIVEHTGNDRYRGDGGDGSGRNVLGQTLMRVREGLRSG
jgi:ribA/ribD-fused uncharacterized protein